MSDTGPASDINWLLIAMLFAVLIAIFSERNKDKK
jgi:hypothetical protein